MNIKMKITKSVNANGFNTTVGSVVTMDIEEYLKCVVPNEMSDYYPSNALKAQAIAARTFAMYRVDRSPRSSSFDIYDNTDDQSYECGTEGPNSNAAIAATAGQVLTSGGNVFKDFFHASSGGRTLSATAVFGNYPCQPEQDDPWTRSSGYGVSGHRVGMSQRGAQWAANNGKTYTEILSFYYPGSQIQSNYASGGGSTTDPTPTGSWGTGTVTGGKLYCRKQPIAGYDYWGRFDDGAVIPIRRLSGNDVWYQTYWAGNQANIGYVMSEFITNENFSGGGSTGVPGSGSVLMVDWFTSDIQSIFSPGTYAVITDVDSGISWNVIRRNSTNHADVEPLTLADTEAMRQACADSNGNWTYVRHAVWVTIDGQRYAASIYTEPHGEGQIDDNGYSGHLCVHFVNSRTHGSDKVDPDHQQMILTAYPAG